MPLTVTIQLSRTVRLSDGSFRGQGSPQLQYMSPAGTGMPHFAQSACVIGVASPWLPPRPPDGRGACFAVSDGPEVGPATDGPERPV